MLNFGPEIALGIFILTIMVAGIYYSTLIIGIVGFLGILLISTYLPELYSSQST